MYQRIMVLLGEDWVSEALMPHIKALAKGYGVQTLIFVGMLESYCLPYVPDCPIGGPIIERIDSANKAVAQSHLARLVKQMNCSDITVETVVLSGNRGENIARYAIDNRIGLIIVATHRQFRMSQRLRGSIEDSFPPSSRIPVVVIQA